MRSYDFGQYLFNIAFLDETQLADLISAAKNKKSTLATKALFLRMISLSELTDALKNSETPVESIDEYLRSHDAENQAKYDEVIKTILKPDQPARLERMKETSSIWLIQELIDSNMITLDKFEELLADYHKLEISPIEEAFATRYESLPEVQKPDYPLALDAVKSFHEFVSQSFDSTVILLPDVDAAQEKLLGATVKIRGTIPVVIGFFAVEPVFMNFAKNYNHLVETVEDATDMVSEFLNIYVGHLTIRMVETLGTEEEPETPRFGDAEVFTGIKMLADCGEFYLYVGNDEYFEQANTESAEDYSMLAGDLSQFGLEDLDLGNFDEKFKDPFDF